MVARSHELSAVNTIRILLGVTTVTASFAFFFKRGRAAVPTVFMVAGDEITVTSHVRRGEARRGEGPLSVCLSLSLSLTRIGAVQ